MTAMCSGMAIACTLAGPGPARAAEWSLERTLDLRLRAEDNPGFAGRGGRVLPGGRVAGRLALAHDDGVRETQLDAALGVDAEGARAAERSGSERLRADASISASQSWRGATWSADAQASLSQQQLDPANPREGSEVADLALGRGSRRSANLGLGFGHAWSERITARADVRLVRVAYVEGAVDALDYDSRTLAAQASWRASERMNLVVRSVADEVVAMPSSAGRTRSVGLSAGLNHALDELSAIAFSAGWQRSTTRREQALSVCPLPVAFCDSGQVSPVRLTLASRQATGFATYSASWQRAIDEHRGWSLAASRSQSASGLGATLLNERIAFSLNHALSPTLTLSLGADAERQRYVGVAESPRPRLDALAGALAWQWAERSSFSLGLRHARTSEARSGASASSTRVELTLRFDAPRRFSSWLPR
jgi:hypothetical protein